MMAHSRVVLCVLLLLPLIAWAFQKGLHICRKQETDRSRCVTKLQVYPFKAMNQLISSTLPLSDTSISEEDVLAVTGSASELPDPIYAIYFAVAVILGVGILQFSLGDLATEVKFNFQMWRLTYI